MITSDPLPEGYFTVRDRVRELGYDYPGRKVSWMLGTLVRDRWVEHPMSGGSLPRKVLQEKTNSRGTHCFAVYPPGFQTIVDAIVTRVMENLERQLLLPFGERL